jgi:hypothetical protein
MSLPSPSHGTCQANPTAGPKLLKSFLMAVWLGFGLSGPMKSIAVMKSGLQDDAGRFACAMPVVHCNAFAAVGVLP